MKRQSKKHSSCPQEKLSLKESAKLQRSLTQDKDTLEQVRNTEEVKEKRFSEK